MQSAAGEQCTLPEMLEEAGGGPLPPPSDRKEVPAARSSSAGYGSCGVIVVFLVVAATVCFAAVSMDLQPSTLWSAGRSQSPLPEESMESSGRKARHACEAPQPHPPAYVHSTKTQPDVVLDMVATIHDYHLEDATGSIDFIYRTRTWCDGSRNSTVMCDDLGIFGPPITVKPGDWLRIKVRNELNISEAAALGPRPPTLQQWYELANNESGRYAGLQSCGFQFVGKLPPTPEDFTMNKMNMPGHDTNGFEGTNVHLHGLEVVPHLFEPVGTGEVDAEMIRIQPGECMTYDVQITNTQPAGGTYWYHPHMHSSVAIQAWSGMAGLVKVLGPLDEQLKLHGVEQDLPFVIWDPHLRVLAEEIKQKKVADSDAWAAARRQLLLGPRDTLATDFFLHAQTDQSLIYFLVNAEVQPTFNARPGETVRLRVLCATTENLAGFEILDSRNNTVPFWQVGSDGIIYNSPVQRSRLVLAGGMREEILVAFQKPGRYTVVSRGLSRVQFFCSGPADAVLAHIDVKGKDWPKPLKVKSLPLASPKHPIQPEEIVESRTVTLSMKADRSKVPFPQFMQNGKPYNESAVEFRCKANTAEEWILFNPDNTMHPFHLHVAPFQVKEVYSSYMPDNPAMKVLTHLDTSLDNWRDTVVVPSKGSVKLWVRWGNWTGKTVAHCHFLAHEDTGMIMNILLE